MKTKHLLTMAAMTLGFAACTQEEIIENVASNPMDRATLENLTIDFSDNSVDSRLVYDDASFGWKWEAGDKFSAFMTDGASQWIVANDLATNYIYSQGEDGSYSTTSQMVEGMYWFFAPAKENKLDRNLISYELSTNQPAGYYKTEASQVYFSSIYALQAKYNAANVVLKPTVYNLYSQAIFHLKNNGGVNQKDMNVLQIILKGATGFNYKGQISPVEIANVSTFVYDADAETFVQTADSNGDGIANTDADLKAADVCVNETSTSTIALNVNKVWKKGETLTATMLVPQAAAQDLEVIIVTDKGQINITKAQAPELEAVSFKHHGAKYVFGKLSDNSMKPFATSSASLSTVEGQYISSAEDMVKLINNSQTAVKVNRVGDWTINEDVINAANNNANVNITFNDIMTVENNSSNELVMNKFTFDKDWILAKGAIKSNDAPASVIGGKLNYTGSDALVNNGGEIIVNNAAVTSVTNNSGKVTFNANVTLSTLTNGTATSVGELVINANKTVNATGTFNNTHFTSAANGVHYDSNIEINGTLNAAGMTNYGTITVNGKLVGGTNEGEIYNAGEIDELTNNEYIEVKDYESTTTNIDGYGMINNNIDGYVSTVGNNVVYFEPSGTVSAAPSGATLAIVKDATLGTMNTSGIDVIFLGSSSIRGTVTVKNLYVGYQETAGTYNAVIAKIVGAWNDSTNKYVDCMAATKLSILSGTTEVSENLYNYATVLNRATVNGAVKVNNAWNGNVPNASSLTAANIANYINAAEDDEIINLPAEGVELTSNLTINKSVVIKGGAISGKPVTVAADAKVTFDGVTFKAVNDANNASSVYYKNGKKNITFNNCTFEGYQWDAIQIVDAQADIEIKVTGCTFKTPTEENALASGSYIHIANETAVKDFNVVITGNKFETAADMLDNPVKIYGIAKYGNIKVGKNQVADAYDAKRPYVYVSRSANYESATGDDVLNTVGAYNKFVANTESTLTKND